MSYYVIIFVVLIAVIAALGIGCRLNITSPMVYHDDVPNLEQVSPGVWRSGEPRSDAGWSYLKSIGVKKVIKLNYDSEGSDDGARRAGMEVVELNIPPLSDLASTLEIPNSDTVQKAVEIMEEGNGVLVHCTHGQDRTGLVVGVYRVMHDHKTKDEAWKEMVNHHFHQELIGLMRFWHRFDGSFPVVDND
jgi:protein tyrosine/serine phosphatase